jgi:hypothetical protein
MKVTVATQLTDVIRVLASLSSVLALHAAPRRAITRREKLQSPDAFEHKQSA